MKTKLLLSIVAGLMLGALPALAQRPLGDSAVFAKVPAVPGFPEGVAVRGNRVYVTGPANFGIFTPSTVTAYDIRTGALVDTFPITLQHPQAMKGLSAGNFGPDGNLYVPEPFMGAVIRMSLDPYNTQEVYAGPFPAPGGPGSSLLNELVFDDAGYLYVTDSFQGTIFRVPPGGGAPEVWLADPRLLGDPNLPFGVNGIRFDKNDKNLYVSVTFENGTLEGVIYRLPRVDSPTAGDLEEFFRYAPFSGPDGIAFGKSGKLYVALAGTSQISVLLPDGTEEARYSGPAANPGGSPDPLPWANPANIAFNDKEGSLLVTNHASLVSPPDPSLFAVFDVFVDDKGQPVP
jgi:hypothetical protein